MNGKNLVMDIYDRNIQFSNDRQYPMMMVEGILSQVRGISVPRGKIDKVKSWVCAWLIFHRFDFESVL